MITSCRAAASPTAIQGATEPSVGSTLRETRCKVPATPERLSEVQRPPSSWCLLRASNLKVLSGWKSRMWQNWSLNQEQKMTSKTWDELDKNGDLRTNPTTNEVVIPLVSRDLALENRNI